MSPLRCTLQIVRMLRALSRSTIYSRDSSSAKLTGGLYQHLSFSVVAKRLIYDTRYGFAMLRQVQPDKLADQPFPPRGKAYARRAE
jgi:hypothetical protein